MQNLQTPDPTPPHSEVTSEKPDLKSLPQIDYDAIYADVLAQEANAPADDAQDSYFEAREPAELVFCVILAAAYAGLARYCWEPLQTSGQWMRFISVEGFFITPALLSLVLGLRPYISPSSLQVSKHGLKYRGPYWPQRRTVNWEQIFRLYLSPELIVVLYHPTGKTTGTRMLVIQSNYLSDRNDIVESFAKYAPVKPVYLMNPDWYIKGSLLIVYLALVCWILYMLSS